jgi:hypothetical protein
MLLHDPSSFFLLVHEMAGMYANECKGNAIALTRLLAFEEVHHQGKGMRWHAGMDIQAWLWARL